ncbi:MAG: [citrate (pro-3S)-lyase] ligase [Synergistaceae bacterium]|jgi:[citrate (pro-3S)-lyase] ligase|nr:[citrate (pro-3S)-lyase] ligase [Synergistaceae bacterium]
MYYERVLTSKSDLKQREYILASRGLRAPGSEDIIYGLFDSCDRLAATGSLVRNIIQGVAVREEYDGEGLTAKILTLILRHASERGLRHLFLFTTANSAPRFASLGFRTVGATASSALLEWGRPGMEEFLAGLAELAETAGSGICDASCVVVNCNPFTLGHRYLIEQAAAASGRLYALVVKEDISEFPFDVRLRLVSEGVSDIGNVIVASGGDYAVSGATFPSYFTREEDLASAHAELDLEIFASKIAPVLRVTRRFAGEEPFSGITRVYNQIMKRVLPPRGIQVTELKRLEIRGEPVSASRVRRFLGEGRIEEARELVPSRTRFFFETPEFESVLKSIAEKQSRQ